MNKYSYTKEVENQAIRLFISGFQVKVIAKKLKLTKSTTRLLLIRNGLKPILRANQYQKIKNNPFLINNELSNYWLGYLISDGNVAKNSNTISFYTSTDLDHLKNIFKFLDTKLKISKNNTCYSIGFSNKEVKEYLISIGITPNKSKTLKLKIELNKDILRGVFDGDGSISQNIPKITCASKDFVKQIEEFLIKNNINPVIGIKDKNKNNCWDIRIKGDDRFKFFELLYKNSTIFMPRKHEKYRTALKKFKVKNIGSIAGNLSYIKEAISSQSKD